jgi:hypothetical protein
MSPTIQDLADAGLALLAAQPGLTVYDGKVDDGAPDHYVVVRSFRLLPDGEAAPDRISLTGLSTVADMRLYCCCVGPTAVAARAVQGLVEAALLDVTPTVAGRTCSPIRWIDGQQGDVDEEIVTPVFEAVDVYGWSSYPG